MVYEGLTDADRMELRAQHCLELEARLFRLQLHEEEEPGRSAERTRAMLEIGARIEAHRAILAPARNAEPEPGTTEDAPEE